MSRYGLNIDDTHKKDFDGILGFSTFEKAEITIRHLEKLCREYEKLSDKKGVEYCRKIALLGRNRAELISRNRRVSSQNRLQKKEISNWFRLWLETPDLFFDWLEMRKRTEAFKNLL
jgi:hypothetical protein